MGMVMNWMPPEHENTSVHRKEGKWVCEVGDHMFHMEQVENNRLVEEDLPRGVCGHRSWFGPGGKYVYDP